MQYYIKEYQKGENTAGPKAREDIEEILEHVGAKKVAIDYVVNMMFEKKAETKFQKLNRKNKISEIWKKALENLKPEDTIIIQFPLISQPLWAHHLLKKIKQKNVKIILIIHDVDILRKNSIKEKLKFNLEDRKIFELSDYIIAHNKKMIYKLQEFGIDQKKMVNLEIFDYLIPAFNERKKQVNLSSLFDKIAPVIIAGALTPNKTGYIYLLPTNCEFNLYGPGFEEKGKPKANIHYFGSFSPDDLPFELEGSFGLVWDGPFVTTCGGEKGDYLRINNPHKTSLYLASGIPVIIWKNAALADFIQKNHCGITIGSLSEIGKRIEEMTESEYQEIKANAENIGKKLREGFYTRKALSQCIS
jgi:hypothetical protein